MRKILEHEGKILEHKEKILEPYNSIKKLQL